MVDTTEDADRRIAPLYSGEGGEAEEGLRWDGRRLG